MNGHSTPPSQSPEIGSVTQTFIKHEWAHFSGDDATEVLMHRINDDIPFERVDCAWRSHCEVLLEQLCTKGLRIALGNPQH